MKGRVRSSITLLVLLTIGPIVNALNAQTTQAAAAKVGNTERVGAKLHDLTVPSQVRVVNALR